MQVTDPQAVTEQALIALCPASRRNTRSRSACRSHRITARTPVGKISRSQIRAPFWEAPTQQVAVAHTHMNNNSSPRSTGTPTAFTPTINHSELAQQLHGRIVEAVSGGRDHLIERHKPARQLLPRERIDLLVDRVRRSSSSQRSRPTGQYGGGVHGAGRRDRYRHRPRHSLRHRCQRRHRQGGAYYPET